jgi:DNA-binding transcriptional MocR family regulator
VSVQTITGRNARDLAASVEQAVAAGALSAGERLPSVRALAQANGLSPTTVAAAFAELKRRGVVIARPRSGMRIADRTPVAPVALPVVPEGVRDLAAGNPDPALLPDVIGALRRLDPAPRLYGADPVDPGLRRAASAALAADGLDPAHLCVTSGALDGIERALAAHLAPGDTVAVEDPGFPAVFAVVRALGLRLAPIRGDAVPGDARAVVLTPRGQNPTGAVLDARRARALRATLRPGVLLVEDDHLGPVSGAPLRTLADGHDRWIAVRSTSKWLGPDLRLAVMAGDATTISRVAGRQAVGPGWVSTLIQRAVADLWADEDTIALADQAATVYAGRRRALLSALEELGIAAVGDSGLNVWIPVPDEEAAAAGLLAAGWAVTPGARFRLASPPAVRVTISTLRPAEARRLAADLAAGLAPASRTRAA